MWLAVLVGFAFGFFGSIPLAGPISVLVFARGVEGRFRGAAWLAAGASIAEAAYAFLAFWGLASLLGNHPLLVPLSRAAAAGILAILGVVLVWKKDPPAAESRAVPVDDHAGASFLLGFVITAVNPTLIATWAATVTVAVSSGLLHPTRGEALPFAGSVAAGISSWFAVLLYLVHRGARLFRANTLGRIVRVTGWFAIALAVVFLGLFLRDALA